MDPPKINFFYAQLRVPVFYNISRYLAHKSFDIVWGTSPKTPLPQMDPPKINFSNG